eukprot:SM000076S21846  [mRNA]  locus=s76:535968:537308:+ [translate_table: standard]
MAAAASVQCVHAAATATGAPARGAGRCVRPAPALLATPGRSVGFLGDCSELAEGPWRRPAAELLAVTAAARQRKGSRWGAAVVTAALSWGQRPQMRGTPPRVAVITSGKGGVGKTTTTANLGIAIARMGYKVVAIDADIGLRNLDLLLGQRLLLISLLSEASESTALRALTSMEKRVTFTAAEVMEGECRLDQALIRDRRCPNLELLCIAKPRFKMPYNFGTKALTWLVDTLKERPEPDGCPDFILIDCPAGIEAGFITAVAPADEAIIVTTPDVTALRDADRVIGLLEVDGIADIKLVVNRVRPDLISSNDMMSVQDVQDTLGLPLLGVIPEDSGVIMSSNRGEPLVLQKPPTVAGYALEQAAYRLIQNDRLKAFVFEEETQKRGLFDFMRRG